MRLEGIHHISAITGDARGNVDFYTRVLGLRMVAKSVNQDDPTVYHLFYADELGRPGSDLTFFEYPRAVRGRAGDGMVHRIVWRVGSPAALDFWATRLEAAGIGVERDRERLRFSDPEGLGHELAVVSTTDVPLAAQHPEVPAEHALQGFDGVRAYASDPERGRAVLEEVLGATRAGDRVWELRGERRGGTIAYDPPPGQHGRSGAGTVHHVAWGTTVEDHPRWLERVTAAGIPSSGIVDRHYFKAIYFREPSGVLFELSDYGPGFTRDLPLQELGSKVILPPWLESRRAAIEARLTPLPDPRAGWAAPSAAPRAARAAHGPSSVAYGPPVRLVRDSSTDDPLLDVAVGHALLQRVAAGEAPATLRLYRCRPTVAFGRLDRLRQGYGDAIRIACEHGFSPVLRLPGGHAAAYHEESLGIDLVGPAPDAVATVHDRFAQTARRLARGLTGLGIDARVGEVPGEYCPGKYSVNARGQVKLIGTAQRLVRGAWLLGAVMVVRDGARVRAVLAEVYDRLALQWDQATVGALEDEVPGLTVEDVERALIAAYALSTDLTDTPLDEDTLALARGLAAEHAADAR